MSARRSDNHAVRGVVARCADSLESLLPGTGRHPHDTDLRHG
jgi:hypothetical protein